MSVKINESCSWANAAEALIVFESDLRRPSDAMRELDDTRLSHDAIAAAVRLGVTNPGLSERPSASYAVDSEGQPVTLVDPDAAQKIAAFRREYHLRRGL